MQFCNGRTKKNKTNIYQIKLIKAKTAISLCLEIYPQVELDLDIQFCAYKYKKSKTPKSRMAHKIMVHKTK